jgi:hypothetical protein
MTPLQRDEGCREQAQNQDLLPARDDQRRPRRQDEEHQDRPEAPLRRCTRPPDRRPRDGQSEREIQQPGIRPRRRPRQRSSRPGGNRRRQVGEVLPRPSGPRGERPVIVLGRVRVAPIEQRGGGLLDDENVGLHVGGRRPRTCTGKHDRRDDGNDGEHHRCQDRPPADPHAPASQQPRRDGAEPVPDRGHPGPEQVERSVRRPKDGERGEGGSRIQGRVPRSPVPAPPRVHPTIVPAGRRGKHL